MWKLWAFWFVASILAMSTVGNMYKSGHIHGHTTSRLVLAAVIITGALLGYYHYSRAKARAE